MKKCNEGGMCDSLLERVNGPGFDKRQGIKAMNMTNINTGEQFFGGVCYKMNGKDKGLLFNFCPFCGGVPGRYANENVKEAPPGQEVGE